MTPGARRRRSAKRRKLGRTRWERDLARARAAPKPRTRVYSGSRATVTMIVDGEEVAFPFSSGVFTGIDRSVAEIPPRHSMSMSFTARADDDCPPIYFTTDHASPWDDLWDTMNMHTLHVAPPVAYVHPDAYTALAAELEPETLLMPPSTYATLAAAMGRQDTRETRRIIDRDVTRMMAAFPAEQHDDRVDALAYAVEHLWRWDGASAAGVSSPIARPPAFSAFARATSLRAELRTLIGIVPSVLERFIERHVR